MDKQHITKKDFNFWVLLTSTLILAVVSILTPQLLYKFRNRSVSPVSPEKPRAVGTSCTLNYTIPTPTLPLTKTPTATPTPNLSPTTTPTPSVCLNCQYQADLFWGPVIRSFAGGTRYSTSKRLINSVSNYTAYPGCVLAPMSPQPTPPLPVFSTACADPKTKGYLTGTISTANANLPKGYLTGVVTNKSTGCTYEVGFASYKANGTNIDIQNLFDYKTQNLGPGQSVTFAIKSPMNNDGPACHILPGTATPTPTTAAGCQYGPYNVPGRVQAENFTCGGEGVAYHDTSLANEGGVYRKTDRVDIQSTSDLLGGYNLGWTRNGEWLNYKINVTSSGLYSLTFRVASVYSTGRFRIYIDNIDITGQKVVPKTGGWQTFTNVVVPNINLAVGAHTVKLNIEGDGANYNFIDFIK